jgi:hypothetical protein
MHAVNLVVDKLVWISLRTALTLGPVANEAKALSTPVIVTGLGVIVCGYPSPIAKIAPQNLSLSQSVPAVCNVPTSEDSRTSRGRPFLMSVRRTTPRAKSTLSHSNPTILPAHITVSMTNRNAIFYTDLRTSKGITGDVIGAGEGTRTPTP